MKKVAIIGCGPAGLSTALALHDIGLDVCLFEQFVEPGPVGSGLMLQPTGLNVLQRWGLREQVESLGQRIDGMLGRIAPDGKVVLDIRYDELGENMVSNNKVEPYGMAIHRASLFHVLYQAALDRGIKIHTGYQIQRTINKDNNGELSVELIDSNNHTLPDSYNFVVDASGSHSKLVSNSLTSNNGVKTRKRKLNYGALWTTVKLRDSAFQSNLLEQRYRAASTMIGILPCGQLPTNDTQLATLFWSIREDQYQSIQAKGLDAWKKAAINTWPAVSELLEDITAFDQLIHANYSHHTLEKPYAQGVIFVGDAAHATSPQLGQGANMAMLDALALSKAIQYSDVYEAFSERYARMRSTHVKLFQAASSMLTPFYQSDSRVLPAIRDTLFEPVSALPFAKKIVASLGAGMLTQPIKRIDKLAQ